MDSFVILKDVKIFIRSDEIEIRKGIFNFMHLIIKNKIDIDEDNFQILKKYFHDLSEGKKILLDSGNDLIKRFFEKLKKYSIVVNENIKFVPDYLFTDFSHFKIKNLFSSFRKSKIHFTEMWSLDDFEFIEEGSCVLILINKFSKQALLNINQFLVNNNNKVIYLFHDGNFIHALYVDNNYTGCFECFLHRTEARIESGEILNDNFNFDTNLENDFDVLILLVSLINQIIISSNRFDALLLESKIFSIYLPTFEWQIDKLLKISYCETCGYNSQFQSKELNINMVNAVREMLKNGN